MNTSILCCAVLILIETPEARELEQRALKERMRIESGIVEVEVEHRMRTRTKQSKYRITFDGSRIRNDVVQTLMHRLPDGTSTEATNLYKFVFTGEEQLFHTDFSVDGTTPVAAAKRDISSDAGRRSARGDDAYRVDPRRIGIIPAPMGFLHASGLETILTRPDRRESLVEMETAGEYQYWRIEYVRNDGARVTLRIDPSRDGNLVESSVTLIGPSGNTIVDRVVSKLRQYRHDGIWFPESATYTRQIGEEIVQTALYKVSGAEFNLTIDPKVFTLSGMGIPSGTMVRETPPSKEGIRYWDGDELKAEEQPPTHVAPQPPAASPRTWLIIANVFLAAAIGLFAIWTKLRASRKTRASQ